MAYFDPDQVAAKFREIVQEQIAKSFAKPDLTENERLLIQAQADLTDVAAAALRWHVNAKNNRLPVHVRADAFGLTIGNIMARFVSNDRFAESIMLLTMEEAYEVNLGRKTRPDGTISSETTVGPAPSGMA